MNREQRRSNKKNNVVTGKLSEEELLGKSCTIKEVVQISRSVSSDAMKDYHTNLSPMLVSVSLQLELLKKIIIDNNIISEEDYNKLFEEKVEEFNKDKEDIISNLSNEGPLPDIKFNTDADSDVEIIKGE